MSPNKSIAGIACAVAMLGLVPLCASSEEPQVKTVSVSLEKLDQSNTSDIASLLTRIERAAKRACVVTGRTWTMTERMEVHDCMDDAIDQAIASIESPIISAALREARLN